TVTLTPAAALSNSTVYTATIHGGTTAPVVKDLAGNALAANVVWSFTTIAPPPTVTNKVPSAGAVNVATSTSVTATFSQAIDSTTITTSTFELRTPGNTLVPAAVDYNAATLTATLTPTSTLANSTVYTVTVRGGATDPRVKDTNGTALVANVVWSFTTIA